LLTFPTIESVVSAQNMFDVDKEGGINISVTNAPLQDVLKNFCSTFNLDVKGVTASNESVSLSITKGTFDETLKRLMRGFNYVLMQDVTSAKLSLVLFGKAGRRKYVEETAAAGAATERPAHAVTATSPDHGRSSPSPRPATVSVQGNGSSRNSVSLERQKQLDEERAGPAMAFAKPVGAQSSTSSELPPIPPSTPGLEMPPAPPTLEQAKGAQSNVVVGENSSGRASLQTPPEIPVGPNSTQQKAIPKLNLKDFTPPSIPF